MGFTLGIGKEGYFEINGNPYPKGHIVPVWDDTNSNLELRYSHYDQGDQPMANTNYANITNGLTGAAFVSYAALKQFYKDYCTFNLTGLPRIMSRGTTSVAATTGGATFAAQACYQLDIVNDTGQTIQYKVIGNPLGAETIAISIQDKTTRMVVGITDASQVQVLTTSGTATVKAEYFN